MIKGVIVISSDPSKEVFDLPDPLGMGSASLNP
jgi:hypothetical protein